MILKNITQLCKEKNIAIAKLERETGIGNGTISRWGTSSPTVENAQKVAEYFGVTIDSLIRQHQEGANDPDRTLSA